MSHCLLYVDSDETARTDTTEHLRSELADLELSFASRGTLADAESALSSDTVAVITEYDLPDGTGFDLIRTADEVCPDAGCILYTDADPETIDTTDLRGSLTEYVGKESLFGTDRLAQLVRTTIEQRSQTSYPVPQTEDERLDALHSYNLDNEELQRSLDRITDLAATHFGVAIASINIIDERSQEFLACYGPAKEWSTMNRESSICTFTLLEDDGVMCVEDVSEDPRFESRSDSLIEMGIQSYMGANLVTSSGLVIGTLCVYGEGPRSFSQEDREHLRTLATTAMEFIELHARLGPADPRTGGRQ